MGGVVFGLVVWFGVGVFGSWCVWVFVGLWLVVGLCVCVCGWVGGVWGWACACVGLGGARCGGGQTGTGGDRVPPAFLKAA